MDVPTVDLVFVSCSSVFTGRKLHRRNSWQETSSLPRVGSVAGPVHCTDEVLMVATFCTKYPKY